MTDRRFIGWMAGLVIVDLVTGLGASGILWWASDLTQQVNDFYTSFTGNEPIDAEVIDFYDRIGSNAYAMQLVASPLLAGTVFALLAGIVVLAQRWEWHHR